MATVPREIEAGFTTYVHFAERFNDFYAPKDEMPTPNPEHVWRYCVAKAQNNTVYFSNKLSSQSIWVLPDLNAAPGSTDAVVMKTVGTVESAANKKSVSVSSRTSADPVVEAKPVPEIAVGTSSSTTTTTTTTTTSTAKSEATTTASKFDDTKKSIQEKLRERIAARTGGGGSTAIGSEAPVTVAPTAPAAPTAAVAPPLSVVAPALSAVAVSEKPASSLTQPTIDGTSTPQQAITPQRSEESGRVASSSPGGGSTWRERLAARRAGKSSRSNTPQSGALDEGSESSIRRASYTTAQQSENAPNLQMIEKEALSSKGGILGENSGEGVRRPLALRQITKADEGQQPSAPPRSTVSDDSVHRDIYEEKRRQMLEADQELQRERAELVRHERIAIERAKLAAEARAKEEENYARIIAERRRLEEQRIAIELREKAKLEALLAKPDASQMIEHANDSINRFSLLEQSAERREEDAKARAQSFREALQQSMVESVRGEGSHSSHHHNHSQKPLISGDTSSSSDDDGDDNGKSSGSSQYVTQAPKQRETIEYSTQIKYIGHIGAKCHAKALGGQSAKPSATGGLPVRSGYGTLYYDAQGNSKYEGKWKNDKRHGAGDMSTPLTMFEGKWKDDKPQGPAMVQTKTLKASVECKQGHFNGNSVIQLATGDTFMGRLSEDTVSSPGAITFSNFDHVEWKWTQPNARGTGECRIQFQTGDSYVGGVKSYCLHGKGAFLSADGHEYIGDFVNGSMEGEGFMRFANGNTYEGSMLKGLFHGMGVYNSAGEYVYQGEWVNGMMDGEGTVTYRNGDVWKGRFEKDVRQEGKYVASALFQLTA